MITLANSIAIALYLLAAGYQGRYLINRSRAGKSVAPPSLPLLFCVGAVAVCAHGYSAINTIYSADQIDLGFFRVSSLIFFFITAICLLSTLRRPTGTLLIALLPLAALSIITSSMAGPPHNVATDISAGLFTHILSSILAYSLLTIAALQAAGLALQERELKHRHTAGILQALPPLQTMEQMLFEIIWIGMVLLTISLVSGAVFIDDIFAQHLVHKTVLSILAWCVFAVLLWGRHYLGWRSQTAVRWTIIGFIALMLAYFGSKLVLELILGELPIESSL